MQIYCLKFIEWSSAERSERHERLASITALKDLCENEQMEVYRSGHNGPDSKSGIRQRIVGSNPTASAKKERAFVYQMNVRSFFVC